MIRTRLAAMALAALLLPAPAFAETSITAYDAARQALLTIWKELPLTVRNVTLTEATATGYGNFTEHRGKAYSAGETIHVYLEVLGYGWKDNGDGTQSELLDADLKLLDAGGATIAGQDKFLTADIRSRQQLLETYLTLDATLTEFPPGDYTLQYVLHDRAGNKQTVFEIPITLVAEGTSSADNTSASATASGEGLASSSSIPVEPAEPDDAASASSASAP